MNGPIYTSSYFSWKQDTNTKLKNDFYSEKQGLDLSIILRHFKY